ncbi:MAG: hypothetical protein U1F25_00540 [Rubrivivax sp.]
MNFGSFEALVRRTRDTPRRGCQELAANALQLKAGATQLRADVIDVTAYLERRRTGGADPKGQP